ncbi:Uma2 family endonuclease [Actinomadura roseirufa]|uniref:Uma2 family endonuclease n=1 Tax=Actinomadura roseirufa TaxID=2094049 RepID=UPI00104146C8|nr:Uma2 family endonuclease [Actinomadura roseirufa]
MPDPEPRPRIERVEQEADAPLPGWIIPPEGGFVAEDLDHLPQLPPHTELIDGSIVLVSPQTAFHMLTLSVLETGLRRCLPEDLRLRREMTVKLGRRQRPEPDLLVLRADGVAGMEQTTFEAEHVLLVVEVVSAESELRDRDRKPELYAQAGIPHFWRIENSGGQPMVIVFELDTAKDVYVSTGVHHYRLKLGVPFDIDIDLTEIGRL